MSRLKLSVVVALLAVLVLLPGCVELAEDQPTPTPIPTPSESNKPTYEVKKGTIVQTVKALGRIAASQEATLFFKQGGRMRRVYVDTNQKVKAGDVLAELETGNLQTQIAQAKINLDIAQIRLAQAQDKAGTSTALAQAQATLDQAEANYTKAKNELDKLKAGATAADLRAAEQQVAAANAGVARAQTDYTKVYDAYKKGGKGAPTAADLRVASLSVTNAKAQLTAAKARLSQLRAPAKASDVTAAQQGVESADASLKAAKANYDNVVTTQGKGGDYEVQIQQKQVELSRAALQILEDQLELGSLANVTVNTQEKKDVLILPNTAIRTFGGRKFVRIAAAGGRNQEVDVEVGLSNETETEIVKGLKEGQLVIGQ